MKVSKESFEAEVLKSDIPVLVDFYADWCGPCKMLAPTMEEIEKENAGKIKVVKVNIDEEEEIAVKYRISVIPTILCFKNGEPQHAKSVGYVPKEDILKILN